VKFMVTWKLGPHTQEVAAKRFLAGGAPMPPGLTKLGRWHMPGSQGGWLLVETDDPTALAQHMVTWGNVLETSVTPVIEDEDAAKAMATVYGK